MFFQVSVIIPVYNAEKYLLKAVESSVFLSEVGEVILVEDNSPDGALAICEELEKKFSKIKLYRHPNGENLGAGASRNLGMEKATCEYIAFLDADDWYLPNRFRQVKELFKDKKIDGVYEPVGTYFYNDFNFFFGKLRGKEEGDSMITFPTEKIESKKLFSYLLSPNHGVFHTNGVTLKKSLIKKTGGFSQKLKLHQDTEFWIRCAFFGSLVPPANPQVVAIRGVHEQNRIRNKDYYSKSLLYNTIYNQYKNKKISFSSRVTIFKRAVLFNKNRKYSQKNNVLKYIGLFIISFKYLPIFAPNFYKNF